MDCSHTPQPTFQGTNCLRTNYEGVCKALPKGSNERIGEIQDLVDLAEPPLGGLSVATSTRQQRNEDMELDAEEEEPEKNSQETPDSPDEDNLGLG